MLMMGSTSKLHLKQLLNEDQDPFVLKNYIDQKRLQLNKPQLRNKQTRNPVSENSTFSSDFCKNVCFFSFHQSPDLRKSPLIDFSSQCKSPCRTSNTLFVHIPAKTAALLLEAALRIQKQSEKPKTLGFFGSILRRIRRRKKTGIESSSEIKVFVKDILRWESGDVCGIVTEERGEEEIEAETSLRLEEKRVSDVGVSCSCNSRVSSAWTESNEEKSLDLETSTSSSEGCEESANIDFDLCEKGSPFRFSLESESSPRRRSPELVSPVTSPNRRKSQVVKNEEGHLNSDGKGQKEEKEHCSPVSVLDPQIDDEVEGQDEDEQEDEDDTALERSFALVHKAKLKLLQKLRRFELLAELDPLELEKRITEDEDEDECDEEFNDDEDDLDVDGSMLQDNGNSVPISGDVLKGSSFSNRKKIALDMKRLVINLMSKDGTLSDSSARSSVGHKCCRRLSSLKDAELNTVNMMVEMDLRGEPSEFQKNSGHVEETVVVIEYAIFGFLLEELSVELVHSSSHQY